MQEPGQFDRISKGMLAICALRHCRGGRSTVAADHQRYAEFDRDSAFAAVGECARRIDAPAAKSGVGFVRGTGRRVRWTGIWKAREVEPVAPSDVKRQARRSTHAQWVTALALGKKLLCLLGVLFQPLAGMRSEAWELDQNRRHARHPARVELAVRLRMTACRVLRESGL